MGIIIGRKAEFDGANAIDAALDVDALFDPQITGTLLPNGTVDDKTFTVYREKADGTQVVLNAGVKGGYHAGSYRSLLNTAEAMFPNTVTKMQTFDDGAVLVFTQDIDNPYTFGDGDSLTRSIMYTASLNSTYATQAVGFSFRPFCTNQIASGTLQVAQKRTRNHDELLFSKAQIMATYAQTFDRFIADATMLKGLPMTNSLRTRILDQVAPLITDEEANQKAVNFAEKRREGIMYFYGEESERFGENAYSLYQAVQTYEYHTSTDGKRKDEKQVKVVTDPEKAQSLTIQTGRMLLAAA